MMVGLSQSKECRLASNICSIVINAEVFKKIGLS